jgi:hypothetical protein
MSDCVQIQTNYDNLYPGSKFTIKDSQTVYTLIGYTSNRNIVYFDDKHTNYINNIMVADINNIDKVLFIQTPSYPEKIFKH